MKIKIKFEQLNTQADNADSFKEAFEKINRNFKKLSFAENLIKIKWQGLEDTQDAFLAIKKNFKKIESYGEKKED